MGKPMMIQPQDHDRLDTLKRRVKASSKAETLRLALDALEREIDRTERIARWQKAARLVSQSGGSHE